MKFIAHRGESLTAPENTMAAFRLAWKLDAVGIEGDFYQLTDGRIACMHDQNAKRTAGVDVDICTLDYPALQKLDAGVWKGPEWKDEKVPLLDDIFAELPAGCVLYAEVKNEADGIVEGIRDLARRYRIRSEQLIIISFCESAILRAAEVLPDSQRFLLTGLQHSPAGFTPSAEELIATLKRIHADGVDCCCIPELDRDYIGKVKAAGLEFHVWTVDDADTARRMVACGVDSITSNCADRMRRSVESR